MHFVIHSLVLRHLQAWGELDLSTMELSIFDIVEEKKIEEVKRINFKKGYCVIDNIDYVMYEKDIEDRKDYKIVFLMKTSSHRPSNLL